MQTINEIMSSQEFIEQLEKNEYVVLDIFAPWCGPCKKLDKHLKDNVLPDSKFKKVKFLKLNIDNEKCSEIVEQFKVSSIPRLMTFKNKKIDEDLLGFDVNQLTLNLDKLINE